MSNNQEKDLLAARIAVNNVYPILEASVGRNRINNVSQMFKKALNQNDPIAFQPAFQEIFNIAGEIMSKTQVLRAIEPHVEPVLRIAGINEARIQAAKGALAINIRRQTTNSFLLDTVAFWFVLIGLAIIALFLIYHFFATFLPWICSWTPNQKPTPMQSPDWNRLWGAVNNPTIGPVYAIEKGQIPSGIRIELA